GDRYRSVMPRCAMYGTISRASSSVKSSLIWRRYVATGTRMSGDHDGEQLAERCEQVDPLPRLGLVRVSAFADGRIDRVEQLPEDVLTLPQVDVERQRLREAGQARPPLEQVTVVRVLEQLIRDPLERLLDDVAQALAIERNADRLGLLEQRSRTFEIDDVGGQDAADETVEHELGGHAERAWQRQVLRNQELHERRVLLVQPAIRALRLDDARFEDAIQDLTLAVAEQRLERERVLREVREQSHDGGQVGGGERTDQLVAQRAILVLACKPPDAAREIVPAEMQHGERDHL